MSGSIRIVAPARIHLGFYNIKYGNLLFGSIGLAIDRPYYDLIIERSEKTEVFSENPQQKEFIEETVNKITSVLGINANLRIHVKSYIERHVGLGSTTQLLMSILKALLYLYNVKIDPWTLFKLIGRKNISGIGVSSFLRGGFIVDSGITSNGYPREVTRIRFPKRWKVLLVIPREDRGLSEEIEENYMIPQEPNDELRCELLKYVFLGVIPGILREDFDMFTYSLEKLDESIGKYYGTVQGGRFLSKYGEDVADALKDVGGRGIGQSSWGPTIYAFFKDKSSALTACRKINAYLKNSNISADVILCNPRNCGAKIIKKEL